VSVEPSNRVQDVQTVDPDRGLGVGQSDQSIVEEDIKPLLVELLLMHDQGSLAGIDHLIVFDMLLQVLDHFDPEVDLFLGVPVDQLADVLSLMGTLLDDGAVVSQQMVQEELVELLSRTSGVVSVDSLR
jgi:hypothetical protein